MSVEPEIGNWYRSGDGAVFEVIGIDAEQKTVSVRHFDGSPEDLPRVIWDALDLTPRAASKWHPKRLREIPAAELKHPAEWTGPLDDRTGTG